MNYSEAIEYIHSINWQFCKPGLDRVKELCHALGDPQDSLKFIHVAGTNGKGSFCAMTDAILRASGLKVGLFTSPYILDFNERMRINGENIKDSELCALVEEIKPYADKMQDKPTEFELISAIAFLYFARNNCDIVILECGLGGKLDATNIIKTPILSVITGIALDHTAILGNTVEAIAGEKAGIIKENVPLLWCGSDKAAEKVIMSSAKEKNAPVFMPKRELLNIVKTSLDGTVFDFGEIKGIELSLLGMYQPTNAANVLTALGILQDRGGIKIGERDIHAGMKNVTWHARFEIIGRDPLIIADGGHNPEGVDSAVESVKRYFGDDRVIIVTGVMADKDHTYMSSRIAEIAEKVFCVTPDNPRALSAEDYAAEFCSLGIDAEPCGSVGDAVKRAKAAAKKKNMPIVCLGSLYMYAEVVRALEQ